MVAEAETVDEPQLCLMFGVSRFHCRACLRAVKPPTFKCEAGHLVCGTCRADHAQVCTRAAAYTAYPDVDVIVRAAKRPCPFSEFGCKSCPVYSQAADRERACPWAPCYCPALGCEARTSPARLVHHFRAAHGWPVTEVAYDAEPCQIALTQSLHVLVAKEDGRVFLVASSAFGADAVAVSLVCVRANNGDAAPQYKFTLWTESRRGGGDMATVTFAVASKDLSGGFVAAEHGSFLGVTPDLRRDASGKTSVVLIKVRIDRIRGDGGSGGAAAAAETPTAIATTPSASSS